MVSVETYADLVILQAQLITNDPARPWATALALRSDRIIYVGTDSGVQRFIGTRTQVLKAAGRTVLPGMVDSHMHPAEGAVRTQRGLSLVKARSAKECLDLIRQYVAQHPDLPLYLGDGFRRSLFPTTGPRRQDLDEICPDKPMVITSVELHSVWVNTCALKQMRITAKTPEPICGTILREAHSGEASGLLQELARNHTSALVPQIDSEQYRAAFLKAQRQFNAQGITTVYDAGIDLDNLALFQAYQALAEAELLTVQVVGAWALSPVICERGGEEALSFRRATLDELKAQVDRGLKLAAGCQRELFSITGFKLFADMVVEEQTAYLSQPYTDRLDGYQGMQVWDEELLTELLCYIDKLGAQIHVHQIGDAAAHYVLQALARVRERNHTPDPRHALAHLQLLQPQDKLLMRQLGVTAIISPVWMSMDECFWTVNVPHLGLERSCQMYPAHSLCELGINVATHSDYPVSEPELGSTLYTAVTRQLSYDSFLDTYLKDNEQSQAHTGRPSYRYTTQQTAVEPGVVGPLPPASECLTLNEVLKALTYGGAYANHLEKQIGCLKEGYRADLVVLNKSLAQSNSIELLEVAPEYTIFRGRIVYALRPGSLR